MPSRHRLSAVAHNVLHSMASGLGAAREGFLSEQLARVAAKERLTEITLDLVEGRVVPEAAATPGLLQYATRWRERWPMIAAHAGADPATVRAFTITARCDPARPNAYDADEAHIEALTALIVDDRGARHEGLPPRGQLYIGP